MSGAREQAFAARVAFAALVLAALLALALAGPAGAAVTADLDQCRNGTASGPGTCTGSGWHNGNLNPTNAHYREGDSVPFRAVIAGIEAGVHTLDIGYDTTESGRHAYDYLTSFDRTEATADPCSGIAGCDLAAPSDTAGIPADSTLDDAEPPVDPVPGIITAWGAEISSVAYLQLPPGPEGPHNKVQVRITFTATSETVVLAWGGHVAGQSDWGAGDAAGSIAGSPYHMRLIALDGKGGNQDRSMKADTILPAPDIATFVSPERVQVGTSVTDTATLTGENGPVTGAVRFFVCGPALAGAGCAVGSGSPVGLAVPVVDGRASADFMPTNVGAYCFRAEYTPATGAPYSPGSHTNATSECFTAVPQVNVAVLKTADAPAISSGDAAAFTIVVANTSGGTARGVTVTDPLPAGVAWAIAPSVADCAIEDGVLECAFGTLVPGESVTVHVAGATNAVGCGTLDNAATVAAANESPLRGSDNRSSAAIQVLCPDIVLHKAAERGTVAAGETAAFVISVTNAGGGTARGVTVSDALPAGIAWALAPGTAGCAIQDGTLRCELAPLPPGGSAEIRLAGATDAADCGVLTNTAGAGAANEPAALTGDNFSTATIAVNCSGAIALAKVADAGAVSAGDPIGFTITASNTGGGAANGVVVSDRLPTTAGTTWTVDGGTAPSDCVVVAGTLVCAVGTLAPGERWTVYVGSPTTAASCSTVDNVALVATADAGAAQAAAQVAVRCGSAQLAKLADESAVVAGNPIAFVVTLRNTGAGELRGVSLRDVMPTGQGIAWSISPASPGCALVDGVLTCDYGTLAPGATRSVHLSSPTTTDSCGVYENVAEVTTAGGTARAVSRITVVCDRRRPSILEPDRTRLGLSKTAPRRVRSGRTVLHTIRVTNRGRVLAEDVVIRDRLPLGLALRRLPANAALRDGIVTWRVGDLRPGAGRTVRLRLQVLGGTAGRRCNVARASADNAATVRDRACTRVVRAVVAGEVTPPVTG
jgi:uncharacterized repeat protein (TIGR01451 family)